MEWDVLLFSLTSEGADDIFFLLSELRLHLRLQWCELKDVFQPSLQLPWHVRKTEPLRLSRSCWLQLLEKDPTRQTTNPQLLAPPLLMQSGA